MAADIRVVLDGLSQLAAALQRPQEGTTLALYAERLAARVDAREWASAVAEWTLVAPWRHFPALPELFAAYQARVDAAEGRRPAEVEAVDAYTRVLQAGTYSPEGGTAWTYRGVVESCGKAAAEAWLAAGAHEAFATSWNADERRRTFLAAYLEAAREQPETRLLPWNPAGELPAAAEPATALPREQAAELLKRLAPEHAAETAEAPRNKPRWVEASPERLARLREQAAAIVAAESAPEGAGRV